MQTLTGIAIKLSLDTRDITSNMDSVVASLNSLKGVSAKNNLNDIANAVSHVYDSLGNMQSQFDALDVDDKIGDIGANIQNAMTQSRDIINQSVNVINKNVGNLVSGIERCSPTFDGFLKASRKMSELKNIQQVLVEVNGMTEEFQNQMDEAQKGMEQLSSCMIQTKIASLAMTAAFAMQAAPLAIFYDIGKKVYANLVGWVTEFNEKNDGLPPLSKDVTSTK